MSRGVCTACLLVASFLIGPGHLAWSQPADDTGRRRRPDYEPDVYGPLPFSEEVTGFLEHELKYIAGRQNPNGSWDSAQPMGKGRTTMEAGGTVDNVTLTSMCGYSLRQYGAYSPDGFNDAIARAVRFVTYMIRSGKLRNNVTDAPWHYIYPLRFFAHEYPNIKDPAIRRRVEDACASIVRELMDMQHGTRGQRSIPFRFNRRSSPGLMIEDTEDALGVVTGCDPKAPAYAAGIRKGDRLLAADGDWVGSAVRYAMAELEWASGESVEFQVSRGGEIKTFRVTLPGQYPGTLGVKVNEDARGVSLTGFDFLSNPDAAPLKTGDRILSVDGRKIAKKADLDALSLTAGQKVELRVERGGKSQRVEYTCAPVPAADFGVNIRKGYDQGTQDGLAIDQFHRGSCLQAAGLRKGDRLLRLDGSLIVNRRHFRELSRSLWGGKTVHVTYLSGGKTRDVTVTAGSLPNERWLRGYHGLKVAAREPVVESVEEGSPAGRAGCESGDRIVEVNGKPVRSGQQAFDTLSATAAGKRVDLVTLRGGAKKRMTFVMNRSAETVWISRSDAAGGGWGYLTGVRGSNTFTTSDALRALLEAKRAMPKLDIPEEMVFRAFRMLSLLRTRQPNSEVESYRYDSGGSFWRVRDIRADIGRLASAELACLMYSDTDMKTEGLARTQKHLERALQEWMKHRAILDLVKFPKGHADLGIAPWFWMYGYRTTLEAADYLTINDNLQERVRRNALKAFFRHMEFRYEEKFEGEAWIIGNDLSKELHDSCQLMDGLATMKHLYRPRLEVKHPALAEAMKEFHATKYGEAYALTETLAEKGKAPAAEIKRIRDAVKDRFTTRLDEVKVIHREYPRDAVRYLEETKPHFRGYPGLDEVGRLLADWRKRLR